MAQPFPKAWGVLKQYEGFNRNLPPMSPENVKAFQYNPNPGEIPYPGPTDSRSGENYRPDAMRASIDKEITRLKMEISRLQDQLQRLLQMRG